MSDIPQTSIESVIQTAIDSALKEVHTCLPAVVISVNNTEHLINAQVTIKRKLDGELVNLPVLQNVPIRHMRTSIFSITMPIKADDHVMILCSERSIDTWLTEGGIQNPFDVRKFSLNDAFAIPMMYSQIEIASEPIDTDNLQIKLNDGVADITLKPTGEVALRNDNGYMNIQPSGEIQLNGAADSAIAFTNMKSAFDQLKSELNAVITHHNAHGHQGTVPVNGTQIPSATADMSGAETPTIKVP